jgi:anti-anti-sigma factor
MIFTLMAITGKEKSGYYLIDVGRNFNSGAFVRIQKAVDTALETSPTCIVFDLSKCEHMDSSAIGLLIKLYKRFDPKNFKIGLLKPQPAILNLISIIQLKPLFTIYNSEEEI